MKLFICIVACLFMPAWTIGNEIDKPWELTIYAGASFADESRSATLNCASPDSDICLPALFQVKTSVGNSALFGLSAGYYFNRNFELEGVIGIAPAHHFQYEANFGIPHIEHNVVIYNYDANLVYNLDWKGIRPFFTAGIGGISRTNFLVGTDFAYNFGLGAKLYHKNLGFRLEVNDHIVPYDFRPGEKKHVVRVQSGLLLKLP